MVRDYDPRVEPFHGVAQSLSRVMVNLVTNGLEALYDKKESSTGTSFQPVLRISTRDREDHVEICVSDNGIGISSVHRDQIFNPFFTTKSPEKGNIGLGLSICYEIVVKEHRGDLQVLSHQGETEFVVTLPKEPVGKQMFQT